MRKLTLLLSVALVLALVVGGCTAAAPTTGTTATEATTAATEAAAAPAGPFAPVAYSAPNCDYGGEFKTIEAVDAKTVKFTLC